MSSFAEITTVPAKTVSFDREKGQTGQNDGNITIVRTSAGTRILVGNDALIKCNQGKAESVINSNGKTTSASDYKGNRNLDLFCVDERRRNKNGFVPF